jgi:flagellar assembly protein FliH
MRPPAASSAAHRTSPVVDTTSGDVSVRAARMDRPLVRSRLDPTYADPHLEEVIRVATERARHEARAEGYAAGWSQGRQAAAAKGAAEQAATAAKIAAERALSGRKMGQLLTALGEAARTARTAAAPDWAEVAETLSEGALRLAAAALGRELRSIDDPIQQAVHSALQLLAEPGEAVIHLNPADSALVLDQEELGVRIISDPRVAVGSVIVLTPAQRLRHDLPAALDAAEAVLRS